MKILYISTAIEEKKYDSLLANKEKVPNPSNQNFHTRLIKALSKNNEVKCLSLIYSDLSSDDQFIYFKRTVSKNPFKRNGEISRLFNIVNSIDFDPDILLVDSLNVSCLKIGKKIKKEKGIKLVSILTDNPNNISKSGLIYRKSVLNLTKSSDASISLTPKLLEVFKLNEKPHMGLTGIAEYSNVSQSQFKPKSFIYYGGTLLPRYGILDLVKAYDESDLNLDLVIAGHHENGDFLKAIKEARRKDKIHYIGQASKEMNLSLEKDAALLINPRPFDKALDEESIPSKVIEYLVSGTPFISGKCSFLQSQFPDSYEEVEPAQLKKYFLDHVDEEGNLVNVVENQEVERARATYSIESVGARLDAFLESIT